MHCVSLKYEFMKNRVRHKLISVVFSPFVTDVVLFYITENAHIRINHHSVGINHGLPCARSTGKLHNVKFNFKNKNK